MYWHKLSAQCRTRFHREMVDTVFMKFRATLAGLLAAVLLSLSSAASACELRCDLARVGAPCRGKASASPQEEGQTMASEMPGMTMAATQQKHGPAMGISEHATMLSLPDACDHPVCSETPLLAQDERTQLTQLTLSYQVVTLIVTLLWSKPPSALAFVRGAPPLPTPTPVSLHTTLRV